MWKSCSDLQIMNSLSTGNIPSPSNVAPKVPPALEAVCMRALAPNADDRYASAAAMQADLERAMQELRLETTQREVGKVVAQWFAETRSTTKSAIEAQLKDPNASMVNLMISDEGGLRAQSVAGTVDLWNVPSTPSLSTSPETPRARPRFSLRWAAAALVGVVVAGVLSFHFVSRSGEATPAPSAAASASPEAKLVRVSIEATPSAARLYLDDVALATNPFEGSLPRDTAQHKVRAEAPGYQTQTLVVGFNDELTLKVELDSASVGVPQPSSRPVKGTTSPQAHSGQVAGAKARPQCSPPFYFDADGIKHPKAECMK
jgi:serine/threonine-protein kinase